MNTLIELISWCDKKIRKFYCLCWGHHFYGRDSNGIRCSTCGAKWPAD